MPRGLLLYPTRAVRADSTYAVARLCAQLAEGLTHRGRFPVTVIQEAQDPGDPDRCFGVEVTQNSIRGRTAGRLLKRAGHAYHGGRIRRAAWYKEALEEGLESIDFVLTTSAMAVPWIRESLDRPNCRSRVILWLHDIPAGEAMAEGLAGICKADAVITPSRYMQERLWELLKDRGYPAAAWTVPHPIDPRVFRTAEEPEKVEIRQRLKLSDGRLVLGFASNLLPHKGLQTVITALKDLGTSAGSITLLVAGDSTSEEAAHCRRRAERNAIDLRFTGRLPPDRLRNFYCVLDALLVPSAWAEPFGMVALEALACGTRVLASKAGGLVEICEHHPAAEMVAPPNSPVEWARAIAELATKKDQDVPIGPAAMPLDDFIGRWERILDDHLPRQGQEPGTAAE